MKKYFGTIPFQGFKKHWHNYCAGVLMILDGLVFTLSLGFAYSNFYWFWMSNELDNLGKE